MSLSGGRATADGVLGVAEMGPFEAPDVDVAGEPRKSALQRIARNHVEQRQPLAQAASEPSGKPLLATEIDEMQFAARLQPDDRLGERPVSYTHLTLPTICSV